MLSTLIVAGLLFAAESARPPDYTERSLCELWAGAQCQRARCSEGGKQRCAAESKRCMRLHRAIVPRERAAKVAECAKSLLQQKCGEPSPANCENVAPP